MSPPNIAERLAQQIDVIDEKTQAALGHIGREEKAAAADEVSPIVRHGASLAQAEDDGFRCRSTHPTSCAHVSGNENCESAVGTLRFAIATGSYLAVTALAMSMRIASMTIFVVFLLGLPARAQSFNRQDLDCAVAAKIEEMRADKGTARENSAHELFIFFIGRLVAQDDETNWARVAYDRSQLKPKFDSAELLGKMRGALSKLASSIVGPFPIVSFKLRHYPAASP